MMNLLLLLMIPNLHANVNFKTAFERALDQNPGLKSQTQVVVQSKERKNQAVGALLPSVNFVYSFSKQADNPSAAFGTIFPTERQDIRLTATQPLFRGMREYAGLAQAKYQYEAQKYQKARLATSLYSEIASVYYNSLSFDEEIDLYNEEIQVNRERLEEIKALRNSGRSREADQLAIESAIYSLEAQVASTSFQKSAARQNLLTISGIDPSEHLKDDRVIPDKIKTEYYYVERMVMRPDILAAENDYLAADEGVGVAFGGHLPSIDVSGNYYLQRGQTALKDVLWDVTLGVTMPLFAGGSIQSQYRSAVAERKNREIINDKAKLDAVQEIKSLYSAVKNEWVQVQKLNRAAELAERNYKLQKKDSKLGLVTQLDVLQAIATAKQTKRLLARARNNLKTDYAKLESATVEMKWKEEEDE
ncbi:MAG: TolC family protein [Xanthomonadaceae bacterium]|nr:TolC family protein [Xanthomonadaceae bacterium]